MYYDSVGQVNEVAIRKNIESPRGGKGGIPRQIYHEI